MAKSSYTTAELAGLVISTCKRYYPNQNFDNLDLVAQLRLSSFSLDKYIARSSQSGFFTKNTDLTSSGSTYNIYTYNISSIQPNILKVLCGFDTGIGRFEVCDYQQVANARFSTEMNKQVIGGILDTDLKVYFGTLTPGTVSLHYIERPTVPMSGEVTIPDNFAHLLILLTSESTLITDGKVVPDGLRNQIKDRIELLK